MDRLDHSKKVVIGCGRDSNGANLQVWDINTNMVYENAMYACPDSDSDSTTSDDGHFKELDDSQLVFTNSRGMAYIFDLENGFSATGYSSGADHYEGDSFVAPRGTVACLQ